MKTEFTPGPWVLGDFNEFLGYDCMTSGIRSGKALLDGKDYGQNSCLNMEAKAKAQMLADARLIAAAPDLFLALQRILNAHDSGNNGAYMGEAVLCRMFTEQARAALAKATGKD